MMVELGTIYSSQKQRELFKNGPLRQTWAKQYPQIFDFDDQRIAESQPNYHFFEWLCAVLFYNTFGYLSLLEQYEFKIHSEKQKKLATILPEPLVRFILDHKAHTGAQCPDLLVYAPDFSDWFFCEIKGPGDKIGNKQKALFEEIVNRTGKEIGLLCFRERLNL
jgi:hypothetical protein